MKVGYFKTKPALPAVQINKDNKPALLPERRLVPLKGRLRSLALPVTGFLLALFLVTGLQVGAKFSNDFSIHYNPAVSVGNLSNLNLPINQYKNISKVELPASVSFLNTIFVVISDWFGHIWGWLQDLWNGMFSSWSKFLKGDRSDATPVMASDLRDQIKKDIIAELKSEQLSSGIGMTVTPSTGSTTRDNLIKQKMQQIFSDQVDIKFDESGSTGVVTPIFRDGRKGGDYVFILTPVR